MTDSATKQRINILFWFVVLQNNENILNISEKDIFENLSKVYQDLFSIPKIFSDLISAKYNKDLSVFSAVSKFYLDNYISVCLVDIE